jgi:S1-C subfamily serine protease
MNINPGSSGSPLFRAANGDVVGVVFAARVHPGRVVVPAPEGSTQIATISLPTGFGYAVPSNRYLQKPEPPIRLPDVYRS